MKLRGIYVLVAIVMVMAVVSCSADPEIGREIYVSTSGSDSADGSKSKPVRSIQKAVSLVDGASNSTIYVATGTYTPGSGLETASSGNNYAGVNLSGIYGLTLKGGWNSDFSSQSGKSIIDSVSGGTTNKHGIFGASMTKLTIDGFVVRNGFANGTDIHNSGAGICLTNLTDSTINNCIISNNTAELNGGGIYIVKGSGNSINAELYNNFALASGGGGGGLGLNNNTKANVNVVAKFNHAIWQGGGIRLWETVNSTVSGTIYSNSALHCGAGVILAWESSNNIVNGTIVSNINAEWGGGLAIWRSDNNIVNATVTYNSVSVAGGGLELADCTGNVLSATCRVEYNHAGSRGGGVVCDRAGNTTNSATIIANNTPDQWHDE